MFSCTIVGLASEINEILVNRFDNVYWITYGLDAVVTTMHQCEIYLGRICKFYLLVLFEFQVFQPTNLDAVKL